MLNYLMINCPVTIGQLTQFDVFEDKHGTRYIHLGGYTINADNVDDKYITKDFGAEYVTYLGSLLNMSLDEIWRTYRNYRPYETST